MISRRDFLRSAGGLTVFALTPLDRGLFAATVPAGGPRLPLFTTLPYIQPGSGSVLKHGHESMVVAWQTHVGPADFVVEYGPTKGYGRHAICEYNPRVGGGEREGRMNWVATMNGLSLRETYFYRVRGNGSDLAERHFTTRQPRGHRIRFVPFGDNPTTKHFEPGSPATSTAPMPSGNSSSRAG